MATTVDERIVAAKFDASDFEKGVNKTVKKLDELKKSLDLKDATKSVKELAEKTEVSTNSMSKSLDKLTERFTTFTGMIKQKILSGLADDVAGIFFKMENSVKSFIKGISSDQVAYGMSKYEQMLSSVRVMMSAGETQDNAYKAIGQLQEYSDQTSYSLSQMTDALSKLRASGVDLDTATKSVEGIANACANAGINATDAQRAFYNLSQAYSSGVLKYTDYRSLELLNMTTEDFKKNILEAAVAAGTLEKASDGTYKTINKNNKKVTAGKKVTEKNLQDMLRYNFVTSDVLNELFGGKFFFDEQKFKEYKRKYNSLEEAVAAAKKDYGETAVNAYLAAREARSFTDVVNTLKDVVSTGWATSFEHLFGKLEEATKFFTALAEGELADVIYKIGEYRNALLGYWDALDAEGKGSGGEVFRRTILNITDALGTLLKTFLQVLPGFDELNNEEEEGQPILESLGDKLYLLTLKIRDTSKSIKQAAQDFNVFMNEKVFEEGTMSRIDMLRSIFSTFGSVLSVVARVVVIAFNAISKAFYTLSPIFDGFLILINKITEPLRNLGKEASSNDGVFKKIEYSVDNIATVLSPIATILGKVIGFLGEIGKFIADMAVGTLTANITFFSDALSLLLELFTGKSAQKLAEGEGVLDGIKKDFEGIIKACNEGLGVIRDFFSTLISDIRTLLGLTDGDEKSQEGTGGVFSGLINFFNTNEFVQKAKAWVNQAIIDVGDFIKSIPQRVRVFGANIYSTLRGLFFEDKEVTKDGKTETETVLTPLGVWLDGVIQDIKKFIISIPDKIVEGIGTIGNWIDTVFNVIFGQDQANAAAKETSGKENEKAKADDQLLSEFDQFIQGIIASCKEWFNDLPNKIQNGMKSVGDFFGRVLNALDEFFFGKKVTKTVIAKQTGANKNHIVKYTQVTERYKTGFSKWLDDVIRDVKKFIADIPKYIKASIKGAGDIINTIVSALFGTDTDKETKNKDIEEKLEKPFKGISLTGILNTIKDIGATLLNEIASIFTGTDEIEKNQKWFSQLIANGINWISTNADIALKEVLKFLGSIPSTIANIFTGGEQSSEEASDNPVGSALIEFGKKIGKFLSVDLPTTVLDFVDSAVIEFGKLWNKLYNSIVGEADENADKAAKEATEKVENATNGAQPEVSAWQTFIARFGETVSNAFKELPVWIANGIEIAIAEIDKLIKNLGTWVSGLNVTKEIEKASDESVKDGADAVAESIEDGSKGEEPALIKAIKSVGERIKTILVSTIPGFISDAWKKISELGSQVFNGFASIFTGEKPTTEIEAGVSAFGQNIFNFITKDIPAAIKRAFDYVTGLFKKENKSITNFRDESIKNFTSFYGSEKMQIAQAPKDDIQQGVGFSLIESFKSMFDAIFGENGILSGDIGKKISDFFLVTVPKFIGKAIGGLINSIPKIYTSFSNGMLESVKKESKNTENKAEGEAETAAEATVRISNAFSGILETFMTGLENGTVQNAAIAIVKLIAIIEILKVVRDVIGALNVTKNLADKSESNNSFTATIKRISTALIAAFALVAYLTMIDDNKRKDAMEVIKDLTHLFELLVKMTTIGSAVSDITGTIQSVTKDVKDINAIKFGSWNNVNGYLNGAEKTMTRVDKLKDMGVASLGTVAKTGGVIAAGEMVQYGLQDILGSVVTVFETLGSGLETISSYISSAVNKLLDIKRKINDAIEAAEGTVTLVDTLSKLGDYTVTIDTLQKKMPLLAGVLDSFKNAVSGEHIHAKELTDSIRELITMTHAMKEFAKYSETDSFEQFKYALTSLGAALSMYDVSGINSISSNGSISTAVDKLKEILGNDELTGLAGKLNTTELPDAASMFKSSEKIVILAGAIASISKASAAITGDAGDNLQKLFNAVSSISLPTDEGSIRDISGKFAMLGNGLGTFANDVSGLTEDKLKSVKLAIDIMMDLSSSLKGTGQGFIEKVFEGDESISTFGSNLSIFGDKLRQFFEAIDNGGETYNVQNVETALIALRTIAVAYRDLNEKELLFKTNWTHLGTGLVGENGFSGKLKTFLDDIKGVAISSDQLDKMRKIMDFMRTLAEIAKLGYGQNANTELGELANQINTENTNGIGFQMIRFFTAVSEMEVDDQSLHALDSFGTAMNALANIAASGLTSRTRGIAYNTTLFTDLSDAFAAFNNRFDSMKTFFVNVKDFDQEGIGLATDLFKGLNYFANTLSIFSSTNVDRGLNNMRWFDWDSLTSVLATNLYNVFVERKDAIKPAGEALAKALFEGMQDAFNNPDLNLQPVITPVLNMDHAKQDMIDFFGNGTIEGFNLSEIARSAFGANDQTDAERVKATDLYPKIDAVTKAVNDMSGKSVTLSNLITAFKNLQIRTDTDVLAGEMVDTIDERIGVKIMQIQDYLTPG